jgi:SAM-dependent methyltransferase
VGGPQRPAAGAVPPPRDGTEYCADTIAIADLGCGAGNLALPLAWWLHSRRSGPQDSLYTVVGVDVNRVALDRLEARSQGVLKQTHPNLIRTRHQDILDVTVPCAAGAEQERVGDNWMSNCSAVVSLHACGAASDLAIVAAVWHGKPFAVSPCCIGKVNVQRKGSTTGQMPAAAAHLSSSARSAAPSGAVSYPRSKWLFHDRNVTGAEFQLLARAADYGANKIAGAADEERHRRSRLAKQIVERDRLQWAFERGYYVRLVELPRIGPLYMKRELLLGAPSGSSAAQRIKSLAVS